MTQIRNTTFDIMKGVAMVLVIAAHTLPLEITRPLSPIWSALFFLISGYFAKKQNFVYYIKHGAARLIVPYVATCVALLPLACIGMLIFDVNIWTTVIKSMALGSSSFVGDMSRINIGPLWFVCALFWVRGIWSFVCYIKNDVIKGLIILLLAVIAVNMKKFLTLPWSILSAFGALGFYFAGYIAREYDLLYSIKGKKVLPVAVFAFLFCVCHGYTNVNTCKYGGWYVVDVVGCLGAFMILYAVIQTFADLQNRVWKFLNFFGRYSLVAFSIHAMDQCLNIHWFPFKFWKYFVFEYELLSACLIRVGIVAIGVFLVSKNKFLREKIFFIN